MRPQEVTVSSQAASAWIPVNWRQEDFKLSFAVEVTGTATYKIQHTLDDVFDSSVTPLALDHEDITASTADDDGNYAFPIRAIRLNVTSYSSGDVRMTVLQAT